MQNKKPFEIILHVGRVTSLQSWVAKKSCHDEILTNECSISDHPLVCANIQLEATCDDSNIYIILEKIPWVKFRSETDKIYGLSFDISELSTANPLCSP